MAKYIGHQSSSIFGSDREDTGVQVPIGSGCGRIAAIQVTPGGRAERTTPLMKRYFLYLIPFIITFAAYSGGHRQGGLVGSRTRPALVKGRRACIRSEHGSGDSNGSVGLLWLRRAKTKAALRRNLGQTQQS